MHIKKGKGQTVNILTQYNTHTQQNAPALELLLLLLMHGGGPSCSQGEAGEVVQ